MLESMEDGSIAMGLWRMKDLGVSLFENRRPGFAPGHSWGVQTHENGVFVFFVGGSWGGFWRGLRLVAPTREAVREKIVLSMLALVLGRFRPIWGRCWAPLDFGPGPQTLHYKIFLGFLRF